jgi:HAD superfamily phosphatase (TIGR01668 family)
MAGLRPDRYFSRTSAIDPRRDIADAGFRCVLLDVDNTVRSRDGQVVPDDVRAWLADVETAGVRVCLLSNNFHASAPVFARSLGLPIVTHAMKPLPFAYRVALRRMGARRRETLCIGDQLSTDIWGAHLAGIKAFLVDPLSKVDLAHTKVVRKVEERVLAGMRPER